MAVAADVDVVIIGGGPAGLSAALCLGRARKRVRVLDGGAPRHAVADAMHNFLTREGLPPAELRRIAWEQMALYPSVERAPEGMVTSLTWDGAAWLVTDARGDVVRARAALLATGVIDQHPDIPGYAERWGHGIHQCPFCHGWEVRDQPVAVLGAGEGAVHMARLLRAWTSDVLVLSHGGELEPAQEAALDAARVPVLRAPVLAIEGPGRSVASLLLADGQRVARQAVFAITPQRQRPLVEALGVALDAQGYVVVDAMQKTSLPMLWAAGDLTSRLQQGMESAAQGLRAGALITAALTL